MCERLLCQQFYLFIYNTIPILKYHWLYFKIYFMNITFYFYFLIFNSTFSSFLLVCCVSCSSFPHIIDFYMNIITIKHTAQLFIDNISAVWVKLKTQMERKRTEKCFTRNRHAKYWKRQEETSNVSNWIFE